MILKKESYVIPKDLMEEVMNVLEDNQEDYDDDINYEIVQVLDKLTNEVYKNEA